MKQTGMELIMQERAEMLFKHGKTIEKDIEDYPNKELCDVAHALLHKQPYIMDFPINWRSNPVTHHMMNKSYKERLIIAGAFISAELDRLNHIGE